MVFWGQAQGSLWIWTWQWLSCPTVKTQESPPGTVLHISLRYGREVVRKPRSPANIQLKLGEGFEESKSSSEMVPAKGRSGRAGSLVDHFSLWNMAGGSGTHLGKPAPAGALFQVLCGACYAAVASFLLPGRGFQTVFFYLCGWGIKFQIRLTVGQSHLREHM